MKNNRNNITAEFPNIDYRFWFERYSWEGFSSINGMITTMKNKNLIEESINKENITKEIQAKITSYIKKNNDEILFDIFKLIQTWGGKSAGKHTLNMTHDWENKKQFDFFENYKDKYREFVRLILEGKPIESFYLMTRKKKIFNLSDKLNHGLKIKGLSYSFVPKHICFWSGYGDRTKGLPILDDVIAKIVYKVDKAEFVDYETFINDMEEQVTVLNLKLEKEENYYTSTQIEMALFAFSGNYWETMKTGTSELKKNPKIKSKDITQAKLIGSAFEIINNKANTKNIEKIKIETKNNLEFKITGSNNKEYIVANTSGKYKCTCAAYKYNNSKDCKHIFYLKRQPLKYS